MTFGRYQYFKRWFSTLVFVLEENLLAISGPKMDLKPGCTHAWHWVLGDSSMERSPNIDLIPHALQMGKPGPRPAFAQRSGVGTGHNKFSSLRAELRDVKLRRAKTNKTPCCAKIRAASVTTPPSKCFGNEPTSSTTMSAAKSVNGKS